MAYRRSLSTRATLIARAYNSPSFSYILRDHHDRNYRDRSTLSRREVHNFIQQRSPFGRVSQFSLGSAFIRHMSISVGEGGGSDNKNELMSNVADVVSDATVTTQVNEVAIAAADSSFPVAALQHFIDAVHNLTGLNWCASIVVVTLLCRCATFPLMVKIRQMEQQMKEDKATDPKAVADYQEQTQKAHKENCMATYRGMWMCIELAVTTVLVLAVSNMVEKVPTFKSGGAFWFTDLTTPDSFLILPILTGLSLLFSLVITIQAYKKAYHDTLTSISCNFSVLVAFSAMALPKVICCYLITSNLQWSLSYILADIIKSKHSGQPTPPKTGLTTHPKPQETEGQQDRKRGSQNLKRKA